MPEEEAIKRLNELNISIRSKILEQLQASLDDPKTELKGTYVKSDGTNYGMYTREDASLTDIWDVVVNQRSQTGKVAKPTNAPEGQG